MISKYPDIIDLGEDEDLEMFVKAYNNFEENPNISNSTGKSENEFQYVKDKETYKTYRSKKYATIGLYIYADKLQKYDFSKNQFTITYNKINIMEPEGNVFKE